MSGRSTQIARLASHQDHHHHLTRCTFANVAADQRAVLALASVLRLSAVSQAAVPMTRRATSLGSRAVAGYGLTKDSDPSAITRFQKAECLNLNRIGCIML